jgi:hypothetical protein
MTDVTVAPDVEVKEPDLEVEAPNLGSADPKTPPVVEDKKPAAQPAAEIKYESTGNTNADYALSQIAAAGIGPDHPAALAALEGDFTLLKHALAAKGVAGSDHLVAMLEKAAVDAAAADNAVAERITGDVIKMAGSQEHWDAVMAWGRENADPEEKEALNQLFSDTKTHKIAAGYLLSAYDRAGGPKEAVAGVVSADGAVAGGGAKGAQTPLTRVQFADEAAKLRATMGDAYINSAEYQALGRRLQ